MSIMSIFRNGELTPAEYSGEVADYSRRADAARTDDRPGRVGSLYAAPTLESATRWTIANLGLMGNPTETYELRVDPDKVYVYPIELWEAFSWRNVSPSEYWEAGIPLSEYVSGGYEKDSEYEVLLRPSDIISYRRVSKKRLLDHVPEFNRNEMAHLLKRYKIK